MADKDIFEEDRSQRGMGHILSRVGFVVGSIALIFLIRWLASRINYKMYHMRQQFWPTVKIVALVIVILLIIFLGIIRYLNIIARKKEYDKHYDPDLQDIEKIKKS